MGTLFVILGIVWGVVSIIVGKFGSLRKIGFGGAFFASLFLSPILAMTFVLASDKLTDAEIKIRNARGGGTMFVSILISLLLVVILLFLIK